MGVVQSKQNISRKINFEDMQWGSNSNTNLIISTLSEDKQGCLIKGTILYNTESEIINNYLQKDTTIRIIIYGENASDDTIIKKYDQLVALGFTNVYVYPGGLFEWLLLQDIYGEEMFKTIGTEPDILKYKGSRKMGVLMLEDTISSQ